MQECWYLFCESTWCSSMAGICPDIQNPRSPGEVCPGAAFLKGEGGAVVCQRVLQALQLLAAGRPVVQRPRVPGVYPERLCVVGDCSLKVPLHGSRHPVTGQLADRSHGSLCLIFRAAVSGTRMAVRCIGCHRVYGRFCRVQFFVPRGAGAGQESGFREAAKELQRRPYQLAQSVASVVEEV